MKIQLTRHYQNMRGQTLKPGVYEANDPALGGLAAYLVENGYATSLESIAPEIGIDPAIPGEDKTIETPAKKKRR